MLQVLMSGITLTLILNERKETFTEIAVTICELDIIFQQNISVPNSQFSEGAGGSFGKRTVHTNFAFLRVFRGT